MLSKVGDVYDGTVTGITSFGAFVKMSNGETGMVHISEIASVYVKDINDHYKIGDAVRVKVIGMKDEKISLSIRQAVPSGDQRSGKERTSRSSAPQQTGPASFEDMLSKFKHDSDDRIASLRRQGDAPRPRRGKQS